MRLTVVGCSGSLPGPGSAASCYLVQAGDTVLVLDLGSGAIGPLQHLVELDQVDAVLLSHLHPDHYMDLCGYFVAVRYGPWSGSDKVRVWGPDGTAERLALAYGLPADPGMTGVFDFAAYPEGGFMIGEVQVTATPVVHPVPAYALRLEHNGRVLTYSGDTASTPALVEAARDADVFICEAAFEDGADNPDGHHLTGREAGAHAAAARAGRLVLTHILPWGSPERARREAEAVYDGDIVLAEPGLVIDV